MSKLAAFAYVLALTTATTAVAAEKTPSGQMMFALQTAGEPIEIAKLPAATEYAKLDAALAASTIDWTGVMRTIREIDAANDAVNEELSKRVLDIVDPERKIEAWYDMYNITWAAPLLQYAAGDESDETPVYETVNHELRDNKPDSKKTREWVKSMRQAMQRLPRVIGATFRGTRLQPNRIDEYYQEGKPVTETAYLSTSVEPGVGFRFAHPTIDESAGRNPKDRLAVVYIVFGKSGRPVSSFAGMHNHEQEVLFANGTPFTVSKMSPVIKDAELGPTRIIVMSED